MKPRKPPKAGRTPKLTPDVQRVITDAVAAGVPECFAAARAGVSARTLTRWKEKAEAGRPGPNRAAYVSLLAGLKKAGADAVARNVALVQQAAQGGTWQAAAWWLERRHGEFFGLDRRELTDLRKELQGLRDELKAVKGNAGGAGGETSEADAAVPG